MKHNNVGQVANLTVEGAISNLTYDGNEEIKP